MTEKIGNGTLAIVLIARRSGINLLTEEEQKRLGLGATQSVFYRLKMADQTIVEPVGLIKNVKISIHDIPYLITFTVTTTKR